MNIFLTGYNGLLGGTIKAFAEKERHTVYTDLYQKNHPKRTDLREYDDINYQLRVINLNKWSETTKINVVIHCASRVSGINDNLKSPFEMIYDNSTTGLNVVKACVMNNIPKLINISSSCTYPKTAEQPFKESDIFDGKLEETNQYYSYGKTITLKTIEAANKQYNTNFYSLVLPNLFGINDRFDERGHIIPQLLKKFHNLKKISETGVNIDSVDIQGVGNALREFIYVNDVAKQILWFAENIDRKDIADEPIVNIGGELRSIEGIVNDIQSVVSTNYKTVFTGQNTGILSKVMDNKKFKILTNGIVFDKTEVKDGIKEVYNTVKNMEGVL